MGWDDDDDWRSKKSRTQPRRSSVIPVELSDIEADAVTKSYDVVVRSGAFDVDPHLLSALARVKKKINEAKDKASKRELKS